MASNEIVVSHTAPNKISVNETTNEITVTKGESPVVTITAGGPRGEQGPVGLGVNVATADSIGIGQNSLENGIPINTVAIGFDTHRQNEASTDNSGKISNNTIIGYEASKNHQGKNNTAIGCRALDTANNANAETENNIVIGYESGMNLDDSNKHNILIGDHAKILKKTEITQGDENININLDQDGNNQVLFDGKDIKLLRFSGFADELKTNAVEFDSKSRLVVPASIKEYVFNFKSYLETVMIAVFEANKNSDSPVIPENYTFDFPTTDRNYWVLENSTYTKRTVTVAKDNSPVAATSINYLNKESFYKNATTYTYISDVNYPDFVTVINKLKFVTDDLYNALDNNIIKGFPVVRRVDIRLQAINGSLQTLDLRSKMR